MMRMMMMAMVMCVAAPAFAGESAQGKQTSEKYEVIKVRPRSAYVVSFTENMKQRQRNRSSRLEGLKAQRLTAMGAKTESALFARTIQMPVAIESSVASK